MKQELSSEADQEVYDLGYGAGTSDQFVPMILIGLGSCVVGFVIGICI